MSSSGLAEGPKEERAQHSRPPGMLVGRQWVDYTGFDLGGKDSYRDEEQGCQAHCRAPCTKSLPSLTFPFSLAPVLGITG